MPLVKPPAQTTRYCGQDGAEATILRTLPLSHASDGEITGIPGGLPRKSVSHCKKPFGGFGDAWASGDATTACMSRTATKSPCPLLRSLSRDAGPGDHATTVASVFSGTLHPSDGGGAFHLPET